MMRQMGAKGTTWEPEDPKLEPQTVQKRKNREGRNIKTQKVEELTKSCTNERLKSENIDISFILQQKIITPRKFHNFE